ncbi:hypothetical protein GCM10009792_08420 [Microcella alkalica]
MPNALLSDFALRSPSTETSFASRGPVTVTTLAARADGTDRAVLEATVEP